MRRINKSTVIWVSALLTLTAAVASATPSPNGAYIQTRLFNDCPGSTVGVTNSYPASVRISDQNMGCVGFANLHIWRFSEDGGTTAAVFNNDACFRAAATLRLTGAGEGEAGLQVAPWWSASDGRFNVRTTDGEIACFGGRMPFYNFSGAPHMLRYTRGTDIRLEVIYSPNGLSMASPATIEYKVTYNAITYSSGVLSFDEGNPAEDPPYGRWGMLNDGRVGGHFQYFVAQSGANALEASWSDIVFEQCIVGVEPSTWSKMKGLYKN
jgi:hypothetical protein